MTRGIRLSALNLALGYVLFGVAALVCFAAPLWYAWQVTITDGRAEILREDAERLADVFDHRGAPGLASFIDARVGLKIAHERMLLFTDAAHHRLAGNLSEWPRGIPAKPGTYTGSVDFHGRQSRAVFVHIVLPDGYNVLVGRDVAKFAPLEARFWYGLAAAIVILSIVGAIGAALIRRELLSRIHGIRQTVSAIMQGKLSHRLPTRGGNDELDTLSQTINRMLDQIEQLIHGISNVSNSIAHDLRTPLAELRSRLEELSLTRPPVDVTFAELEAAVADVDRVISIFNALLRLAEIDTGMRRSGFVPVDVAHVCTEVVEFYLPAAELKSVALSLRSAAAVTMAGDPVLLAQAVSNLVDNALKYTPPDGNIAVEISQRGDGVTEITVADNGPGIPDAEKPKAAERFFRGDASRGSPGVGLGLSIVEAVARLHGGTLQLTDNHPGLRARMVVESGTDTGYAFSEEEVPA
ncbi:MAG TPA: HAMP domain-containing sensor histidine kinase [Burkholderiales bacterium]|nr:HAMP domain-containing sensor histidine kinase [Burkholderiales bacterium]